MTPSPEALAAYLQLVEPPIHLLSSQQEVQEGYVVERLTFDTGTGTPVRGLLTRPVAEGRFPAILYAHSHGDRYDVGAAELLEGREYLLGPWGPELARRGYVALSIDMPTFGSQSVQTESSAAKALIWYGRSLIGRMLEQQMAALTYLGSRADVDGGRIGGFGISLGSTLSYWQAAVDGRLKAIAHLCCFADYATLVELGAHDHHGVYLLVPGMLNEISTGAIAGLVAPRPQLICVGRLDELTPPLSVERALRETEAMYAARGAAGALGFYEDPGAAHQETLEMRSRVLAHFARYL
ncbi:MAG TPA: hypothetical protein VFE64_11855 [Devosia sp.]|jgi:hypothetical protein|nr:hypothetical protein [Devosia sp.]